MNNGVGIDYGSGGKLSGGGQRGKIGTTVIVIIFNFKFKYLNFKKEYGQPTLPI